MAQLVLNGALLKCSFGAAPSSLTVLPKNMVSGDGVPAATIMDNIPNTNIMPFGACSAPSNPQVIAAQGAPQPCVPMTTAPWAPGSATVLIKNNPALNSSSKLICNWAGVIEVNNPGGSGDVNCA